jgi:hypothetical protein
MPLVFNLSPIEILILLAGLLLCAGLAAGLVVVLVVVTRKPGPKARPVSYEELEDENARLREEISRLKKLKDV